MNSQQLHLQHKQSPVFATRKKKDDEFIHVNVFHQIPIECQKNQMGLSFMLRADPLCRIILVRAEKHAAICLSSTAGLANRQHHKYACILAVHWNTASAFSRVTSCLAT